MKIGILTFHRAHNYGAVLQCYALQQILKIAGHDVYVIDYRQPTIEHSYKVWSIVEILKNLFHLKSVYVYFRTLKRRKRTQRFFEDFSFYFNLSEPCNANNIPVFDAYIIGSDQLWVPRLTGGNLDLVYIGQFCHLNNSKILSYAISMNTKTIDSISQDKWINISANFDILSFREEEMACKMGAIIDRKIRVDIDPTLLLDASQWDTITNEHWKNEKYILVYHLPGRFTKMSYDLFMKKTREIAYKRKCKLISLYPMDYSVFDFVSLFKYADCVITTSFHATVFALIYERPLLSIVLNDGLDNRYVNLLNKVGGEKALVGMDMNNGIFPLLPYNKIKKQISLYAKSSLDYLNHLTDYY